MIDTTIFGTLPKQISANIIVQEVRHHSKASEAYVDAIFVLERGEQRAVSIPVNYRRTGVDAQTVEDCTRLLEVAHSGFSQGNVTKWFTEANAFWNDGGKLVTKPFFDVMSKKLGRWVCQGCELPANPNWARRTQDIKEMGYTFATNTKLFCSKCQSNKTHLMLVPIPRGSETGYETWSPQLRSRILRTLSCYDAYENCTRPAASLLPDHKFPEIRWDADTREENPDEMPSAKICAKFQLLTNQRNQQKREVCRSCFQTGTRGTPFGVKFFYKGAEQWSKDIPKTGPDAEAGCVGCGWYDLAKWRLALNNILAR